MGPDGKEADCHTSVPSPLVTWCSAAVDVLFLIDGSHSIGKGSFERAKHFAITVCDALDISPDKVSTSLSVCVCRVSLVASERNPSLSRRGHLLLVGVGRPSTVGSKGPVPLFLLSVLLSTVVFLSRQVFRLQHSYPALSFKLVTPAKRKWPSFPAAGRSPSEGSDWASIGHMTVPYPITVVQRKRLPGQTGNGTHPCSQVGHMDLVSH